jgi:hypothetical protein
MVLFYVAAQCGCAAQDRSAARDVHFGIFGIMVAISFPFGNLGKNFVLTAARCQKK